MVDPRSIAGLTSIMKSEKPMRDLRWVMVVFSGLLIGSAYQISQQLLALGVVFSPAAQRWYLVIGLAVLGVVNLLVMALTWTPLGKKLTMRLFQLPDVLSRFRWLCLVIFVLSILVFPLLVLVLLGDMLIDVYPRFLVFGSLVVIGSISLKIFSKELSMRSAAIATSLIMAFVYQIATLFTQVNDYPLSIGWSETSRFYYASLFAAQKIYGMAVPPSVLHPSRYLMQAVPFFLGNFPLWAHRLWQVLLWIIFTTWAAYLFARRLTIEKKWVVGLITIFAYFFLFQGPVYYHLAVPLVIILGWFDRQRFWRNLILVILASAWAGISRLNWFPVPGMLAATLYLLEEKQGDTPLLRYLIPPAIWGVVGTGVAFLSQTLYMLWSGNDPTAFSSSVSSDMLWYRLLPNSTYPLGIIYNVLLVSFPVLWVMIARLWARRGSWSWIRTLGLWAVLLVLFVGGLVVSVKIGGGSNLHNVDAYLALLLVIGGYFYFDRFATEAQDAPSIKFSWLRTLVVLAIPTFMMVKSGGPLKLPPQRVAAGALAAIQQHVDHASRDGGDVLFISQRHLTIFDDQFNTPLIPDYEKVFFMEMVMSRNPDYLNAFYDDLEDHRYAAIVTDQALTRYEDRDEAWSEEHNIWVQFVSRPLLCYYQPRITLKTLHQQVLYPRLGVTDCSIIEENRAELPPYQP